MIETILTIPILSALFMLGLVVYTVRKYGRVSKNRGCKYCKWHQNWYHLGDRCAAYTRYSHIGGAVHDTCFRNKNGRCKKWEATK